MVARRNPPRWLAVVCLGRRLIVRRFRLESRRRRRVPFILYLVEIKSQLNSARKIALRFSKLYLVETKSRLNSASVYYHEKTNNGRQQTLLFSWDPRE